MNVIMYGIAKDFFIHGSIIAKKSLFCDLEANMGSQNALNLIE